MIRPLALLLLTAATVTLPSIALSQAAGRTVWNGVYSQAQAARGAAQYATTCAGCHGDALGGSDQAPPLAGGAFLSNWNGQSAGALFTRIKTTMPLDNPGSLSGAKVADVEAFILSRNGFPAGEGELTGDAAAQASIAIRQDKPAP